MHIILGILGMVVTILVLVKRLSDAGINFDWLNPFLWRRRRAWRNKYEGNPIFSLSEPLEVAALLATSTAKVDGDLSREEKEILLALFQSEFGKSEKEASDLLMSSNYLFADGNDALAKPDKILKPCLEGFSKEQAQSVMEMLNAIIKIDSRNAAEKVDYVNKIDANFRAHFEKKENW